MDLRQECEMDEKRIYVAIGGSRCLGWGVVLIRIIKKALLL